MGQEADRLLREQIATLEEELSGLGDERADDLGRARQEQRERLERDRALRDQRQRQLTGVAADLERRIAALDLERV
jgi:hypothetical protein